MNSMPFSSQLGIFLIILISIFAILSIASDSDEDTKNDKPSVKIKDFYDNTSSSKESKNSNYSNSGSSKHNYFTSLKNSNNSTSDYSKENNQSLKKKGSDYEKYIAYIYKTKGYDVVLHGVLKGKKDGGIDIICTNGNELLLIQCKNWESHHKWKINHTALKSFIGSCTEYVNENKMFQKDLKLIYITSNDILDSSAKSFLKDSKTLKHYIVSFDM